MLRRMVSALFPISEKTVKRHIANIYKKLHTKNRKEAIQLAQVHDF
jgi:DNA-binding CsgD family transcriptional regulator